MRRYCGLRSTNLSTNILQNEEVSLVPVGESQTDFSSLKVFKKRLQNEQHQDSRDSKFLMNNNDEDCEDNYDEESGSACSDESGYDEVIDCSNSITKIVLV
ncbi:hypothetical protein QE152_g4535 [Popillia japonica]|uniref:Uncharacterized protein n=1 Tax=Popillia japonica TaxID=7064 RepID=A0AAW1MY38_POPJA